MDGLDPQINLIYSIAQEVRMETNYLTPAGAASFLSTTETELEELREKGNGPDYLHPPTGIFYRSIDIERWLNGYLISCSTAPNTPEITQNTDDEDWDNFKPIWYSQRHSIPIETGDIFQIAKETGSLLTVRGDRSDLSQVQRIGRRIKAQLLRTDCKFVITDAGKRSGVFPIYRLTVT
jgi:hypothetical protein